MFENKYFYCFKKLRFIKSEIVSLFIVFSGGIWYVYCMVNYMFNVEYSLFLKILMFCFKIFFGSYMFNENMIDIK